MHLLRTTNTKILTDLNEINDFRKKVKKLKEYYEGRSLGISTIPVLVSSIKDVNNTITIKLLVSKPLVERGFGDTETLFRFQHQVGRSVRRDLEKIMDIYFNIDWFSIEVEYVPL
jgi:hypothetical protein